MQMVETIRTYSQGALRRGVRDAVKVAPRALQVVTIQVPVAEASAVVAQPGMLSRVLGDAAETWAPHLRWSIREAPGGRGSEVQLELDATSESALSRVVGKLLGPLPTQRVLQRALFNLKSLLEAGEVPSLHHNPAAR